MKEQVDLLKSDGDVAGLVRFFFDSKVPEGGSVKQRGPILQAKLDAAAAVAKLGTPEAINALIQALEGTPNSHSYMLADALAITGDAKAVDALIRMARKHESADVRFGAAGALAGRMDGIPGRRDEIFDVLESARDDSARLVRNTVALRLRAEDPRSVDILIPLLADEDHVVRGNAANGLFFLNMSMKDPRITEALQGLASDPNDRLRNIAMRSGAATAAPSAGSTASLAGGAAAVIGGVVGAVLGTLLGIGIQMAFEIEGRFYLAFLAGGIIAGSTGGRALVSWSRDRGLPKVQDLQQAGDVDALLEAFRESGPGRRSKAGRALAGMKDPRSVEPLIEALGHSDADVRKQAAQTLGNLGDPRAIEPLRAAEGSSDQMVKIMAGAALKKLEGS